MGSVSGIMGHIGGKPVLVLYIKEGEKPYQWDQYKKVFMVEKHPAYPIYLCHITIRI